MAKTSILTIMIQLAKKGDADRSTIKSLAEIKQSAGLVVNAFTAVAGVAATGAVVLGYFVKAASEAERVDAKLAAVLKSTAGAAGMSAKELDALANAKSRMTGIDDEVIKNGEAVLLTFTSIGREVFPDATQAALDMSAVLGGDLQQSIIQIGKALNVTAGDTATASMAMTAMRRSGVSFTEEQKKMALQMVKTGDIMGYQQLILAELNREFGGAAEAMGNTTAGSADKLKNSVDNLAAAMGENALPAVAALNKALAEYADRQTEIISQNKQFNAEISSANIDTSGWGRGYQSTLLYDEAVRDAIVTVEKAAYIQGEKFVDAVNTSTSALAMNEEQIKAVSDANTGMLDLIFRLQDENNKYNESLADVNAKFEDAKYVQDLYKQSKSDLLVQAQAGTITWEQYSAQVASLSASYNDGSFAAQQQAAAVSALAEEHERASQRIAFALLQQKASVDGLTTAEFHSLLSIGEQWGILDAKTVESAAIMDAQMQSMADAMDDPTGKLMTLNGKWKSILDAPKNVTFTVKINTIGSMPNVYNTNKNAAGGGGGAYNPYTSSANIAGYAEGGRWTGGWAFVGERGFEMISPTGEIIPHDVAKWLVDIGIMPNQGYYTGYSPSTTSYSSGYYEVATKSYKNKKNTTTPPPGSPSIGGQSSSNNVDTDLTPIVTSTEDAVRSATAAQQQQISEGIQTRATIEKSNAAITDQLKAIESLLRRQEATLKESIVAGMITAAP